MEQLQNFVEAYPWINSVFAFTGTLFMCVVAYYIARRFVIHGVEVFVSHTKNHWDDYLVKNGVFNRLAWLAPALIVYYAAFFVFDEQESTSILQRLLVAYMTLVVISVIEGLLSALLNIYQATSRARKLPIKGYIQVFKILVGIFGTILAFSALVNRSPWGILSGIGAISAVLLLVFKDTILSFVASIQIATTGMIRVGDWVSMPKFAADGDVVDIALHRVLIQNWDKTITYIPTHKFLDEAFTNWRGMSESGGRRIKRAVLLDQSSVRFLTKEDINRLSSISLLTPYLERKKVELEEFNDPALANKHTSLLNGRRLTNLGTFRAYIRAYLENHPHLHQDRTLLVRQLEPGPTGIPMELYAFSSDIRWANYESIQSDIFDHLIAALPEFGLRVFQSPSGANLENLIRSQSLATDSLNH